MNRFGMKQFLGVAVLLVAGPVLMAQTTGALSGGVKDAKGAPLTGARVTLTSPAMFNPRIVSTDNNGEWKAPLLPAGNYKIMVSKEGYIAAGVENVRVGLGSGAHYDLTLKPIAAASATVEVVAQGAEMDKADTKSSANFSAEQLLVLPGADRGFAGAADLAPGVVVGLGGSYSIRGGATQVRTRASSFFVGGDIVVAVNGVKTESMAQLYVALENTKPGDKVEVLTFMAGG